MSEVTSAQVEAALQHYTLPHLNKNPLLAGAVKALSVDEGMVSLSLELGFPVASIKSLMQKALVSLIGELPGVSNVSVEISTRIPSAKQQTDVRSLDNVKNIIAVASGKGGVGKSTTAVNLALALAKDGARVGLLDADIYGPSQQVMLGIPADQRPDQQGQEYLLPIEAHGIKTMSMGFLVTENTPMVWRGPMAGGALNQLLSQTWWGELDYLIIDMPPGTGDIQLTLSQKAAVAGAVIVTTPQDIALLDAKKGIEMFRKVEVPVLGVVENMAIHICSECGHSEHIFGEGGGNRIAAEYQAPLLGALPLSMAIRQQADGGEPTVVAAPDSNEAQLYGEIARNMAAQLALQCGSATAFPHIVIKDD